MEKKESKFYRIHWFKSIVRHGLFWHGLRNRLARIGIDIKPYYWVQEGMISISPPKIRSAENESYDLIFLKEHDIVNIKKSIKGIEHLDLLSYFKEGQLCIGLKSGSTIAAYMFAKSEDITFGGRRFKLKPTDAYLHGMYTFEAYRGKNIAPYLRYQSYEMLKSKGINNFYSVSEYFNKSTIKFKGKLKAKHLKLFLGICLFKKYKWNFRLNTYKSNS